VPRIVSVATVIAVLQGAKKRAFNLLNWTV